jgi:hypothetical protein
MPQCNKKAKLLNCRTIGAHNPPGHAVALVERNFDQPAARAGIDRLRAAFLVRLQE